MKEKIFRNYLELKSFKEFREVKKPSKEYYIELADPKDFQINKFFYKKIGKNCQWVDRLIWTDMDWIKYISDEKLFTHILKNKDDVVGYFELLFDKNTNNAEIAYFGILDEYFGKKLGGYLLSEAIKFSFNLGCVRLWVHTCSLDHKNALNNYQSRGMKICKSETLVR